MLLCLQVKTRENAHRNTACTDCGFSIREPEDYEIDIHFINGDVFKYSKDIDIDTSAVTSWYNFSQAIDSRPSTFKTKTK